MAVSDWSTTAGSNTTIDGINIGENCSPANLNNATRAVMAAIKTWYDTVGTTYQTIDPTLTALAGLTTAANKLVYATGSDTFSTTDLSAFARTLLDDANAGAARTTLGVFDVAASSLANPGYIKFSNGVIINWGTGSIAGDTTGTISYTQSYATFAVCVVSGANSSTSVEGNVSTSTGSGLSSQAIINSGPAAAYQYIAIGV